MKKKFDPSDDRNKLNEERKKALSQLEEWFESGMALLGLAWFALTLVEMVRGLSGFLGLMSYVIWGIFILDFVVRFSLAPHKPAYLKQNWLTALSLLVPALRALRVFRAFRLLRLARVVRSSRLLKIIGSMNRGLGVLRSVVAKRGLGYVLLLTLLFTFLGAAGMYSFEKDAASGGFTDYGDALWWTAMVMTTMGSQYWPQTAEGRLLSLLLATYAFAIFGYVTATIASFFIGQDKAKDDAGDT